MGIKLIHWLMKCDGHLLAIAEDLLHVLMIFQVSLEVFADPEGSVATDVLARELSQLGVIRQKVVANDEKIRVGKIASGAFPAIFLCSHMLKRVSAVSVAAEFTIERHGADAAPVSVEVHLHFLFYLLFLFAYDHVR